MDEVVNEYRRFFEGDWEFLGRFEELLSVAGALPEALATACAKCTKSQIEGAVKVIRYLR